MTWFNILKNAEDTVSDIIEIVEEISEISRMGRDTPRLRKLQHDLIRQAKSLKMKE